MKEQEWTDLLQKYPTYFIPKKIQKKETIIQQGQIAQALYVVETGTLRLGHLDEKGQDITLGFFQEGQIVSSFQSFYLQVESDLSIQALEDCFVLELSRQNFEELLSKEPSLQEVFTRYLCKRFFHYSHLFLSRIKYSPQERYQELVTNHPQLLEKVPHHYIASYLGITPVSLSRIRKRTPENKRD